MKTNLKLTFITLTAAYMLTGCGGAMQSNNLGAKLNGSSSDGGGGVTDQLKGADLNGSVEGGQFNGVQSISLDSKTFNVLIKIPLPHILQAQPVTGPIAQLPGASYSFVQEPNGSWSLVIAVPVEFLKTVGNNWGNHNPARLPNGDPLPGIPGGELPQWTLDIPNYGNAILYLGPAVMGVYVPTKNFDPFFFVTLPIKSGGQKQILGYFSTVPQKKVQTTTFDGGFFVSLIVPKSIARLIDDYIRR